MAVIRVETEADRPAVAHVHRTAFGDDAVPGLVDALRAGAGFVPELSLVADAGPPRAPDVVGHVMLTWIPLETAAGGSRPILCLAPLGVRPDAQGRGIGRALVEAACARAEAAAQPLVVLEGDPRLYARFGFVAGSSLGLRRPSERTPEPAFQVRTLSGYDPDDAGLRGRVLYPDVFWDADAVGLPMTGPAFLDTLERQARDVERWVLGGGAGGGADLAGRLARPVHACPGWTVADVLRHLGLVHRFVAGWVTGGRRPRTTPTPPAGDEDALAWFADGWRPLHALLDDRPASTPTATWSPWDATCGFWRRRMAHETAVHALDVAQALGAGLGGARGRGGWSLPEDVAVDGVDEVVRLWLGTRLAGDAGGDGGLVRLVVASGGGSPDGVGPDDGAQSRTARPQRLWTVGLHGGSTETHDVPTPPDAVVTADPVTLYRWLWGRADDAEVAVEVPPDGTRDGAAAVVADLRAALTRALR